MLSLAPVEYNLRRIAGGKNSMLSENGILSVCLLETDCRAYTENQLQFKQSGNPS